MQPLSSSLLPFIYLVLLVLVLLLDDHIHIVNVNAQGCTDTCPPINFGKPVEALCVGDNLQTKPFADIDKMYTVCHPRSSTANPNQISSFALQDFAGEGKITVVANYYTGCNAGRRESGVFAHVAQRFYNQIGNQGNKVEVTFIQSVKGGGSCEQWADIYQEDARDLYPNSNIVPREMPLSVNDVNYEIRDDLFTTPFGHPSYVILDGNLNIRHKFIGPCCGYESYFDCTSNIAKTLDDKLTGYINALIEESSSNLEPTPATSTTTPPTPAPVPVTDAPTMEECQASSFSDWSECSLKCGTNPFSPTGDPFLAGIQFRWRTVTPFEDPQCPSPIETRPCAPPQQQLSCSTYDHNPPPLGGACISEIGGSYVVETVASGFSSPRDVAFHPTPGMHLGEYSEGRRFFPNHGEEAWVVNGGNHSVSIVASLGTMHQTTISRRDRGYYHYMTNVTSIAFNHVSNSGRTQERDGFNYFAVCNDDTNTYLGKKEPNFFMGPTLYSSDPKNRNLVNRLGEECREEEPCYFLHSDMLHEAPACIGMAHDPELLTAYGNVYWAFDATGNRQTGQLVRFDFQQPHGPGSMDHSVAAVRRYVEVELERGPEGVHAGMVVHPTLRQLFIAVPGANKIIMVNADSGNYARTAREEYPIFSNRLPSFEYSIWECVEQKVFAQNIQTPSGMALSNNGKRLFVAERATGNILIFEIDSGAFLHSIPTGYKTIGGMSISPLSNEIYFVDDETNTLNKIQPMTTCDTPFSSRLNPNFLSELEQAEQAHGGELSLTKDYRCKVNPEIPDSSYFDQVHSDTGYASENEDVQSIMAGMDASAALLANRTDCGYDSDLNFDALLLGGFYCHICLPEKQLTCDAGGQCSNVQWLGYLCDNEFVVSITKDSVIKIATVEGLKVESDDFLLRRDVTYRFTVLENEQNIGLCTSESSGVTRLTRQQSLQTKCATKGPLMLSVTNSSPSEITLFVEGNEEASFTLFVEDVNSKRLLFSGIVIAAIVVGCLLVASTALLTALFVIKKKKTSNSN